MVDTKTGELLAEEKKGDKIKYTKAESMKAFEKLKESRMIAKQRQIDEGEKEIWDYNGFYKGNVKEIQAIMPKLDVYERAFLYSLAPYVGYDDCCLKYMNGNELDIEKMAEISGISKRKMQDVIQGLIKKDIVYRGKNSKTYQYFMNPWLFCKGRTINKVLRTMFKNYKIQTRDGVAWRDLKEE